MRRNQNERSSYFRELYFKYLNFFCHINNMGVEVILHRGSPHLLLYFSFEYCELYLLYITVALQHYIYGIFINLD